MDVCNEDILSGTYSLSVSIDYDSNIENIKFLAEFYARGRALDENGSYLPVDEFRSVELRMVQNSNNGNFTMELQLEMTEQFQTTPSLDLYVYLEITVMNGDRHAEYDRITCSEEFIGLDETSLQTDFRRKSNEYSPRAFPFDNINYHAHCLHCSKELRLVIMMPPV